MVQCLCRLRNHDTTNLSTAFLIGETVNYIKNDFRVKAEALRCVVMDLPIKDVRRKRPLPRLCSPHPAQSRPAPARSSSHDLIFSLLTFHILLMPTPTVQTRGIFSHSRSTDNLRVTRTSPSTPTSPWKSMFRIGSHSSRKLPLGSNNPSLTLDTDLSPSNPPTPNLSLTPASFNPPSQRDSSNSSNNSSDSNNEKIPATPPDHAAPSLLVSPSPDASFDARHSSRSKSGKQQLIARERSGPLATATTPGNFFPDPPPHSSGHRPRTPRSMGATASRLIRRVASAPNAKGLFSLSSRQSAVATKNGLLAPATIVPPAVPGGGIPTSPSTGDGASSIETVSSVSSNRAPRTLNTPALPRVAENNPSPPARGKATFRRTYSSNSIKVKSVSG